MPNNKKWHLLMSQLQTYLDRLTETYKRLNDAVIKSSKPGHAEHFSATHNQLVIVKDNAFMLIAAVESLCSHDGPIDEIGQNELLLIVDEFFELAEESLAPIT